MFNSPKAPATTNGIKRLLDMANIDSEYFQITECFLLVELVLRPLL